jgi:hypothetical protein
LYTVKVEATGPFGVMKPFTYVIDLAAMRDTGLETDSIEWSTHVIAEQSKKSAKAQEEQAKALGGLTRHIVEPVRAPAPVDDSTGA